MISIIVVGGALGGNPAAFGEYESAVSFAKVEVGLSDGLRGEDIRALPRIIGSELEVPDSAKRIRVQQPSNDDCGSAIAVEEGVPYVGSTVGATGAGESSCAFNDWADVWHSYTPANTGLATISLCGSGFDTTLAVFDECGGTELACNDDYCDLQSQLTVGVTASNTYLIRVAGYDGETGDYTLTVTNSPCVLPSEPNSPSPANDVNDVSLEAVLSWNGGEAYGGGMSVAGAFASKGVIRPKVIYGQDDRLDEYEMNDANILAVGDSTVALVSQSDLIDNGDGTFSLPAETFAE